MASECMDCRATLAMTVIESPLDSLNDSRNAHAATDAQGGHAVAQLAPVQLVNQGADQHGTGGTVRVAHGDRATIDVDLVMRHFHLFHEPHHYRSKGFIHFK